MQIFEPYVRRQASITEIKGYLKGGLRIMDVAFQAAFLRVEITVSRHLWRQVAVRDALGADPTMARMRSTMRWKVSIRRNGTHALKCAVNSVA